VFVSLVPSLFRALSKFTTCNSTDAALRGVRLAVCEETAQSDVINEATVKKLTGTEVVTCRGLYKDYVTFEPMQLVSFLVERQLRASLKKQVPDDV
jgi:phage/plasmid-associated DNA primase